MKVRVKQAQTPIESKHIRVRNDLVFKHKIRLHKSSVCILNMKDPWKLQFKVRHGSEIPDYHGSLGEELEFEINYESIIEFAYMVPNRPM